MNRRHFFKSLAAVAGATSMAPLIFIPKFEPVKWKKIGAYSPALSEIKWGWVSSIGDATITDLITPEMGVASSEVLSGFICEAGNYKIVTEEVKFTTPSGDTMLLHVDLRTRKFRIGRA